MEWAPFRRLANAAWRWITFRAIDKESLSDFLKSPLPALILVAVSSTIPFPWDPQFADARTWNVLTFVSAVLLLVLLIILTATIPGATAAHGNAKPLPSTLRGLVWLTTTTSVLFVALLVHARFFRKSFLVKWPADVFSHDALIGGTFSHVNFAREQFAFYVCTEVPDRSRLTSTQQWLWRCWLDQHPPDVEFREGLWQATCRFGNEENQENDRENPAFEVVPVVTERGVHADALPGVVDANPEDLPAQLRARDDVSCAGAPFHIQRWARTSPLPIFKRIYDSSQDLSFTPPATIRYSICPDAVIEWERAPGATSDPVFEVFFDGVSVARGDGTKLSIASVLSAGRTHGTIDIDRWRRKERMELKISHDPMVQHYRNMYLYLRPDEACKAGAPANPPTSEQ